MAAKKPDLVRRMEATQHTVDAFKGRVFEWGKADCIQLVVQHARNMGVKKLRIPAYSDTAGAVAVLKQLGFRTLAQAMDHHFTRIDPHGVLAGDIVECPGGNGFTALSIAVGNGRMLGFHEDVPHADILQPLLITGAWRV